MSATPAVPGVYSPEQAGLAAEQRVRLADGQAATMADVRKLEAALTLAWKEIDALKQRLSDRANSHNRQERAADHRSGHSEQMG